MFLIAGTVFVTSCNKDEDTQGPTLNLKGGSGYVSADQTISAGDEILVGVMADAGDANLSRFKLSSTFNNVPTPILDTTFNSASFDMDFALTFSEASVGANRLLFEVWDKDNNRAEKAFIVTVESNAVAVNKYSDIELGSHNDAIGSFYNSAENLIYTVAVAKENQAKVDFIYYYGDTHGNTIASPDDEVVGGITTFQLDQWTTKNATRFMADVITAEQFDAIGDDYEFPPFTSTDTKFLDQLEVNDVLYFKTAAGKLGFIKVVSVTTPNRGDRATFDIIVQE